MKMQIKILLLLLMPPAMLRAQGMQAVVPAKPSASDTKPNNPDVPDGYTLTGHFDRIVVMRFKFKTKLIDGMEKMVAQEHIRNGVILSAIGSVRGFAVHQVSTRDFPSNDRYAKYPTTPADLVNMNGYVIDGRIHAHVTFATPDKVIAGHLERETEVFTFVIVTVGVMNGTDLNKVDDETYR